MVLGTARYELCCMLCGTHAQAVGLALCATCAVQVERVLGARSGGVNARQRPDDSASIAVLEAENERLRWGQGFALRGTS